MLDLGVAVVVFCIGMCGGWLVYVFRGGFCVLVSDSLVCVVGCVLDLVWWFVIRCGASEFVGLMLLVFLVVTLVRVWTFRWVLL